MLQAGEQFLVTYSNHQLIQVAMVGGLIIVPVISLITKKQSKEEIDNMFQCYETMVEVPVKESLED